MLYIDYVLVSLAAVYAAMLFVLAFRLARYRPETSAVSVPFVSVLIPARNEASRITRCLEALTGQTYPPDRWEVIVVDDRSDDDTRSVAESYAGRFHCLRIVSIAEASPDMASKKWALTQGIAAAQGEVILCTDADCRPGPDWVRCMASLFTDDVGMGVGYSPIEPGNRLSLFHHFVALDSLALGAVAAATASLGKAMTATGRSLAYRKKVFHEVGGFSRIARFVSGDDDLLLQLVRRTRWKIAYSMDRRALVSTDPPASFGEFIQQKIRQASKGIHYSPSLVFFLAVLYVFNLFLISYVPARLPFSTTAALPWLFKAGGELVLLAVAAARFRRWKFLTFFPIVALLHPLFIVVFGLWGQVGKFEWKSDRHSRTMAS